ncbi:MAG: acyl-CoA reductase [Flavobacteriales bacterium]|nr:acyl-CoA reductase [Flavobacteriia bacterium]NCP06390.1 acyl-CoA reductase [Flavobacteriales bacterium]PIV94698.1 MAG: acyl-CoA reductase [Flavobacteriaceae bacterium CG17_big_fil_post_rev_8_21_14_2_50_33_15]PIY10870.1 MAG: acyl-CoA reductase [Flavobacteriaceae bacterium CG_4_10_14_3_um_filter_33_47]PJB20571.1 MAG: acyl-CoA reductase [Flavobacteriaceae bacterium CG_4_9_14_3_um_filter_33_16]
MNLQQRINAFVKLGEFLSQFSNEIVEKKESVQFNDLFFDGFKHQLKLAEEHNGWFTKENMAFALNGWVESLTTEQLSKWLSPYNLTIKNPKIVAIIMAGNIPLVGFHDFLSVLISGHKALVKQSSNDKFIIPYLAKYLVYVEPKFKGVIQFTEDKLENFDAVIATGSDNTARYFEYYFKNKPSIIRNNRNSIAVLNGQETLEDMQALSEDIFRYYGLGCRNVSKLYVPKGYNFDLFFQGMYHWHPIIEKAKYANNYDYNKAVYIMSEFDMLENGFLMIKEDSSAVSPIATVFYEYYNHEGELKEKLQQEKASIQCMVSNGFVENEIAFGMTQKPQLWDYADDVDSIEFLLAI